MSSSSSASSSSKSSNLPQSEMEITVGSYRVLLNENRPPKVIQNSEIRLPSLVVGGVAFSAAAFKNHPRAKLIGFSALCASAALNHVIDMCRNKDKVVFSVNEK